MVVKVYISGLSASKEVKKRQQRVLMILDSKHIQYEVIDITEPTQDQEKLFMQENSTKDGSTISDPTPRHPLPPQLFNDQEYCGDYEDFDMANEIDTLEVFLKVEAPKEPEPAKPDDENKENKTESNEDQPIDNSNENNSIEPEVLSELQTEIEAEPQITSEVIMVEDQQDAEEAQKSERVFEENVKEDEIMEATEDGKVLESDDVMIAAEQEE